MLPGTHFLSASISVSDSNYFGMNGANATVFCNKTSAFNVHHVLYFHLSGINFTNCVEVHFYYVRTLVIENSSILNQYLWKLYVIANVTIASTSFSNGENLQVEGSSLLVKQSTLTNAISFSCQGAASHSNITVKHSIFSWCQGMVISSGYSN